MKILAIEVEKPGVKLEDMQPYLVEESKAAWKLQQEGTFREIYFRTDKNAAVIVMEAKDVNEAKMKLRELPLVEKGFIDFEVIGLKAYPGYGRLFK